MNSPVFAELIWGCWDWWYSRLLHHYLNQEWWTEFWKGQEITRFKVSTLWFSKKYPQGKKCEKCSLRANHQTIGLDALKYLSRIQCKCSLSFSLKTYNIAKYYGTFCPHTRSNAFLERLNFPNFFTLMLLTFLSIKVMFQLNNTGFKPFFGQFLKML